MNYFDAQRYGNYGREEEGAAVLSRHPIVQSDFILLPRFWDDDEGKVKYKKRKRERAIAYMEKHL